MTTPDPAEQPRTEQPFANRHFLITGATGSAGRRIAQALLDRGAHLRCLVRESSRTERLPSGERVELARGSADSVLDIKPALHGIDTVVLAAPTRLAPHMLDALVARETPVRLVVLSSTRRFSKYSTPSRRAVRDSEERIMKSPEFVRWTILRASMIFGGPSDHNIERLAASLRRLPVFPLFGGGRSLVQPLFVLDLVAMVLRSLELDATIGHTYTLAGPEPMAYRAMVETVARHCDLARPPRFVHLPVKASLFGARLIRTVWPGSPLNPEMIQRFAEDRVFSIEPARRDLDFEPTPFEEALAMKFRREV